MKIRRPEQRKARVEILPLIDIVFLLLVVFIYAMLSMSVHRGVPVVLPDSTSAEVDRNLTLSVTLKSDGGIYLDQERIAIEALSAALKNRAASSQETGVLLFADKTIPYQAVFRVLDRIQSAGLTRVSLQAEADRQQ
jgi:biopolymer transport protein ExbD